MGITEAASEKNRGRGRPPLVEGEGMRRLAQLLPAVGSRRGQLNKWYELKVIRALQQAPGWRERFAWLFTADGTVWRASLLAELGRFGLPLEALWDLADQLCQKAPPTKAGVAWLRRLRKARRSEASAVALAERLGGTLECYAAEYPELTKEQRLDALALLAEAVRKGEAV